MGSCIPEEGEFYNNKGELVQIIYGGIFYKKKEMRPWEWDRIVAKKNSFWGWLLD